MMRSMFSGVSGLRAHQTRMDVIGNNVANVNTVAFKSGRVTFQEIFSQTLSGAGAPDAATGRGGRNPMQVGLGLGVGAVDTIFTRGSVQRTDNPTDLSIEGDGFFIVKGGLSDTFRFTRAGNFGVDKLGNLVTGGGLNVYGWQQYIRNPDGSYTFDTEKPIEPINLYSDIYNKNKRMIAAKATENAVFSGNLDASKPVVEKTADFFFSYFFPMINPKTEHYK
jgi:flagellar hook protein FlgE